MRITILYSDIIDKCKMLSMFEGRNNLSDSGESLYLETKITEQDKPFITQHAYNAALFIQGNCERMISKSQYDENGFSWDILPVHRLNQDKELFKYIQEAIVAYTIYKWCEQQKQAMAQSYAEIWNSMVQHIIASVHKRMAPTHKRK